jgi:putative endonuclease
VAAHNDFGVAAEQRAGAFLEGAGYEVLHRNWRWRHKELDLVARRGDVVAFVEVRARTSTRHGHPLETVTWRKRREVTAAGRAWAAKHGRAGDRFRFDVIAILPGRPPLHIENAWPVEGGW